MWLADHGTSGPEVVLAVGVAPSRRWAVFFLKLFCFILKDSAFALSQFEPDESARGQSHLGDGG